MDSKFDYTDEQEKVLREMEALAKKRIDAETARIRELIEIVNKSVTIRLAGQTVLTDFALSSLDLEGLAVKIPAECLYLQGRINQINAESVFREMDLDAKGAVALSSLIGAKGTADERKKQADLAVLDEKMRNAVNKLVIKGIQGCIDRADKVYEGVKKVMDFRSKEGWFDRKAV